ncbi:MAG: GspE/PulE family protein [Candidatus Hodarchaeota archaeon]
MAKEVATEKVTAKKQGSRQLGQLLMEQGLITSSELSEALDFQREKGGKLGEILIQQGLIEPEVLLDILSMQLNVPVIDVKNIQISPDVLKLIPETMAREHSLIPLQSVEGRLLIAMADPYDIGIINDIRAMTGMKVEIGLSSPVDVERVINLNYKDNVELDKQISQLEISKKPKDESKSVDATNTPVAQSLFMIIKQAVQDRASDIHLEPQEDSMKVRVRIDGILHDLYSLPLTAHLPLMSRLKVLGEMNIAEQRRAQDGQFSIKIAGKNVDIRVASIGTLYGERATLRILDKSLPLLKLEELGLLPEAMQKLQVMLKTAYGLVLVGGPTGSGKTTTLYSVINHLQHEELNIMTVEDPIEYRFSGISQIQTNLRAGITFASGLRAIVRQDPDVILIGEIRDKETAEIAVQAALTGHLVLASIHANDAIGMLFRLLDLGIDPFLISSTLIGLIAQRMVRRVCNYCRVSREPSEEEQATYSEYMKEKVPAVCEGKGCTVCANTGYYGRTGVFEIVYVNEEIRSKMLKRDFDAAEMKEIALKQGIATMGHDGMIKVKDGTTSISEVLRCINTIG